jgi:hypothetical protein
MAILTNIYMWIGISLFFILAFFISFILIIILGKKTHAIIELKSWMKGKPIALFFSENRYCEWKIVTPEAGIITDKLYGAFIINERATYVDRKTKAILIPFDASFGASINVHAAKLADDLQYVMKDEEEMKKLRWALANNLIDDSKTIDALKTSIHFGAIKNMVNALIPHNINAKIEMVLAQRLANHGKVNVPQVILLFAAIFGAICLGALVIYLTFGKKSGG